MTVVEMLIVISKSVTDHDKLTNNLIYCKIGTEHLHFYDQGEITDKTEKIGPHCSPRIEETKIKCVNNLPMTIS